MSDQPSVKIFISEKVLKGLEVYRELMEDNIYDFISELKKVLDKSVDKK